MKLKLDELQGRNPVTYAREVMAYCKFSAPPICEEKIVDALGMGLSVIRAEDIHAFELATGNGAGLRENLNLSTAFLHQSPTDGSTIYVNGAISRERMRMGVVHECGHAILPWQGGLNYFCSDANPGAALHRRVEREAYLSGSEMIMPASMFVPDLLELDTSFSSVDLLASRYGVSKEATSINYARLHPGFCATAVVQATSTSYALPGMAVTRTGANLHVKYYSKSTRFPRLLAPRMAIPDGNLIFDAWSRNEFMAGEIPASVFGSSERFFLRAECRPVVGTNTVTVLLWRPDTQIVFDESWR